MASASGAVDVADVPSSSSELPDAPAPFFTCVLTGDKLFSKAHRHAVDEDGLVYRVRGDMAEGLATLGLEQYTMPPDADGWPLRVIDVVRDAGLRHVLLDKPGFIKHWQRYIGALQQHVEATDSGAAADSLLLRSHDYARKLMCNFDELDFLVGASESSGGPLVILHYLDDDPITPCIDFLCVGAVLKQ